jgi:glycosyltransferase involved in cell wall biosynthesis
MMALQKEVSINHVFSPGLYHYPVLNFLKRPIVYSVTASIHIRDIDRSLQNLENISNIIVSNSRDFRLLESAGFNKMTLVRPAVNTKAFKKEYLPLDNELVLLMASAPWELDQFKTKGIDLLLHAVKVLPFLKLILLWRGTYEAELLKRIKEMNVGGRIEIINRKVEVNAILERTHGTILIAKNPNLVKAFPHSLIESLAAGKPVITASVIAMADYITEKKCGVVVDAFSLESLITRIEQFRSQYVSYSEAANRVGAADFSIERMLDEMGKIYKRVIDTH